MGSPWSRPHDTHNYTVQARQNAAASRRVLVKCPKHKYMCVGDIWYVPNGEVSTGQEMAALDTHPAEGPLIPSGLQLCSLSATHKISLRGHSKEQHPQTQTHLFPASSW